MLHSDTPLTLRFGGVSLCGPKPRNQDAFAARLPDKLNLRQHKGAAMAIADGVSSSRSSQEASQMAVLEFLDEYFSTPATLSVSASVAQVLRALNNWFCGHNQQLSAADDNSLVTTFTAVVIKGQHAHVFHAGDSRAWLFREGELQQLTQDHLRRHNGQWVLTRGLGIDRHLELAHQRVALQPGDLLMLSSDGLHGSLTEAAISAALSAQPDLEMSARALAEQAYNAGSQDNASCLLARVEQLPGESLAEVQQRLSARKIPPVLRPGLKLDGYEVLEVLHSSTRSHLYRVRQLESGSVHVLKAPSPRLAEDLIYLAGFAREQWLGQQLDHPRILRTLATPAHSNFLYGLCEYVPGQSLRQWIIDHPKPALSTVRSLLAQIIDGLRVLQRNGVVHRDLKPENLMVDAQGQIKIIDFGTARIAGLDELGSPLREEVPVGSVNYIAPEYLLEGQADARSDLFSLACVVYEMLSGKLPYDMEDSRYRQPSDYAAWHYRPLRRLRPDLPLWLDLTLRKATAAQPDNRHQAYSEFLQDMNRPGADAQRLARSRPLIERNPLRFWQGLSALLAALLLYLLLR